MKNVVLRSVGFRRGLSFALLSAAATIVACSSDDSDSDGGGGSGGEGGSGGDAVAGASGEGSGEAGGGAGGTAGESTGGSGGEIGVGGSGGETGGSGGSGGEGGASGSGGEGGTGGVANVVPTCITLNIEEGLNRAPIECDYEIQSIDFDVAANYPQDKSPGYDPGQTTVSFTDYGTAFSGFEVQECHPYCYRANLTIGVDFLAATETSQRGEVLFDFPATVAPIANAVGRDSLGWFYLDGPALPAGATLTAQMVLKSSDKGILLANGTKDNVNPGNWIEFKYFPIQQGYAEADLTNITAIGFRFTLNAAPATDWHGVVYADHFQLRQP